LLFLKITLYLYAIKQAKMKNEIIKATHRIIDSVWTLEYEIVSKDSIRILNYSRDDIEGYNKEKELPQCRIIENPNGRIIESVLVRNEFKPFDWVNANNADFNYTVVNPQYIFSYKPSKS